MVLNDKVLKAQEELDIKIKQLSDLNNSVQNRLDVIQELNREIRAKKEEIYRLSLEGISDDE